MAKGGRKMAREMIYYMHSKGLTTKDVAKYFKMKESSAETLMAAYPDEKKSILEDLRKQEAARA